ncbi:MAG: M23 family metallopeptidase [Sandaracinaceae bacterium]|nr:M23 family metallopeptidase [Sandaracinaceae bacterium]
MSQSLDRWIPRDAGLSSQEELHRVLSDIVYSSRLARIATTANDALSQASIRPTTRTPLYQYWSLVNLITDGEYEAALDGARRWCRSNADYCLDIDAQPVLPDILSLACQAAIQLGGFEAAAEIAVERLNVASRAGVASAGDWRLLAQLVAKCGDEQGALDALARGAEAWGEEQLPELCRRDAKRILGSKAPTFRSPWDVAAALSAALRSRDQGELTQLASRTHFRVGYVGGHAGLCDADTILPTLVADLCQSTVTTLPQLIGSGGRRYLLSDGWRGATFVGGVQFLLTWTDTGWEWGGCCPMNATPCFIALNESIFGRSPRIENHPLEIPIKAPWPRGLSFQAGGSVPWGLTRGFLISDWALAERPCGWGPSGWYYNQTPHENKRPPNTSADQFAIDFARWRPSQAGFPENLSRGTPVLAVNDGYIYEAKAGATEAEGEMAIDEENVVTQRLTEYWGPPTAYHARYVHMEGPFRLNVMRGMWVQQGAVLGTMGATGNALHPHLHFTIQDKRLENEWDVEGTIPFYSSIGRSVRPSPMDGQDLNDEDDGKCIGSTNDPVPPAVDAPRATFDASDNDRTTWSLADFCAYRSRQGPPEFRSEVEAWCVATTAVLTASGGTVGPPGGPPRRATPTAAAAGGSVVVRGGPPRIATPRATGGSGRARD